MGKKVFCFRCCLSLTALLLFQPVSAKSPLTKSTRPGEKREVENLIRDYYEACSREDRERIHELLEMGDQALAELRGQWARECGLEGYEVIRTEAQPMKEDGMWFVYAEYEVSAKGFEVTIPGASCHVVQKTEDRWRDVSDSASRELSEEVQEIVHDYVDEMEEVNRRYNDVVAENPEVWEWLNTVAQVMQEKTYAELGKEEENRQENQQQENRQGDSEQGTQEDIYIVLPGDCLWHIAELRLGDGRKWTELYEWNREAIGENPDLILTGTELRLSDLDKK